MTREARLWVVLVANVCLVGALLGVGLTARSVGVWAEGADYLADAAAIGVALLALRLEAPSRRRAQGRPRATRWAALVNAGWLLVLTVLVGAAAIDRLVTGIPQVRGLAVLLVSGVAALVMAGGALLLGGDVDEEDDDADEGGQLSVRAVLLDTAADAAAAAGVAAAGGVIFATGHLFWLDPAVALAISAVIVVQAVRLLARIRVALQS